MKYNSDYLPVSIFTFNLANLVWDLQHTLCKRKNLANYFEQITIICLSLSSRCSINVIKKIHYILKYSSKVLDKKLHTKNNLILNQGNIFYFSFCMYSGSISVCPNFEEAADEHLNRLNILNLKHGKMIKIWN